MSKDIGNRICNLMRERNATVRAAADSIGVAPSTLANWRSGSPPKDFVAAKKLADLLGVSFHYLLLGEDPNAATKQTVDLNERDLFSGVVEVTIRRIGNGT
jgi:transcriptional regulator with XRE-family HTH domain